MTDKNALRTVIKEAFNGVVLEGVIGIREANAIDDYKDELFREECKKNDEKENWDMITSSEMNKYNSALSFFDAKGMRFHLPAFMLAEIEGEYKWGMSFVLTNLSDYSKSQFALLNKKQREAVRLFLEYLLQDPNYEFEKKDIESAIKRYWSK
jgi:hypothetical protein